MQPSKQQHRQEMKRVSWRAPILPLVESERLRGPVGVTSFSVGFGARATIPIRHLSHSSLVVVTLDMKGDNGCGHDRCLDILEHLLQRGQVVDVSRGVVTARPYHVDQIHAHDAEERRSYQDSKRNSSIEGDSKND